MHPSLTGQVNVREICFPLLPFFFSLLFDYNPFANIYFRKFLLWGLSWFKAVLPGQFRFNCFLILSPFYIVFCNRTVSQALI